MDYKKYFEKNKVHVSDGEEIAITLGGLILAARLHSGMSQAQLAKKIGTQQPSVARAESGELAPSVEFLYKIAKAIGEEFIFPKFGFMERENNSTKTIPFDGAESPYCILQPRVNLKELETQTETEYQEVKSLA